MSDRFYVERVKYLKDGTYKKAEQMDYETQQAAEKKFYKNVSTDMEDDTLCGSMNVILNSLGGQVEKKFWKDPETEIEERYFVARVKELKDGTFKKSEVMDYDDKQSAVAKLYTNIGTDMDDDTLQGSMCTVLDKEGNEVKRDTWNYDTYHPPIPPEPPVPPEPDDGDDTQE